MRVKSCLMAIALVAAIGATGCGDDQETGEKTTASGSATANKKVMAPASAQSPSASKEPGKRTILTLPKAEKLTERKPRRLAGLGEHTIEEKLEVFAEDVGSFWQGQFEDRQVEFDPATVYIVSQPQQIACDPPGMISPTDTPYYCDRDSSLALPVQTLDALSQNPRFGDAAVATFVGAFYGLHVENVVGLVQGRPGRDVLETAICFDGVWVSSIYDRDLLEDGDLDKVAASLAAIGDDAGITDDLVRAFDRGYSSGEPGDCVQDSGDAGAGG